MISNGSDTSDKNEKDRCTLSSHVVLQLSHFSNASGLTCNTDCPKSANSELPSDASGLKLTPSETEINSNMPTSEPSAAYRGKTSLSCSFPLEKVQGSLTSGPQPPDNLTSENKIKLRTRKLLCLYCDRSFVSVNLRQKHIERVHIIKLARRVSARRQNQLSAMTCMHCDKLNFSKHTLNDLFQHFVEEHPLKYFGCLPCEERFFVLADLVDHNSIRHSTENKEKPPSNAQTSITEINLDIPKNLDQVAVKVTRSKFRAISEKSLNCVVTTKIKNKKKTKLEVFRNKKFSLKTSQIALKRSKRLQAQIKESKIKKICRDKKRTHNFDSCNNTKQPKQSKDICINPYPEFDNFYRVKKITDHSIDNLKISSLTFNDVFDKAFFNRAKSNIKENLLYHIDGKLFKNDESESRISSFEKILTTSLEIHNSAIESHGYGDLSLNAVTPALLLSLNPHFGEDFESHIDYGSKHTKKRIQTKCDEVHYKYLTRRKYQASILQQKENRDLSKLDMWTQMVIKERQEKITNKSKTAKEIQEYTLGEDYKNKIKVEELNRILDKRGPFEDLREEATKKAAFDKFNQSFESGINQEVFNDVREILNEIIKTVYESIKNDDHILEIPNKEIDVRELPAYLDLRRKNFLIQEEMDKSDRIALICSSQETEDYELPTNTLKGKHELVELTGEWARSRMYICAACSGKFSNIKYLLEHRTIYHQHVWAQHYEFVGNQSELYRHLSIPCLGKVGVVETTIPCKHWKRSEARVCTKCKKLCNSLSELHRHILECGGDWTWMLARKKCKYRPFGAKSRRKRRGLLLPILNKKKTEPSEKKNLKKPLEYRRQKPSDADTIQRMLANLPAKRSRRSIISLRDVVFKSRKPKLGTSTQSSRVKRRKIIHKKQKNKSIKSTTNQRRSCRSLRSLNKVLSSKILDSNSSLMIKRNIKATQSKALKVDQTMTKSGDRKNTNSSYSVQKIPQKLKSKKNTTKSACQMMTNDVLSKNKKSLPKIKLSTHLNIKSFFPIKKNNIGLMPKLSSIGHLETSDSCMNKRKKEKNKVSIYVKSAKNKKKNKKGNLKGFVRTLSLRKRRPLNNKEKSEPFKNENLGIEIVRADLSTTLSQEGGRLKTKKTNLYNKMDKVCSKAITSCKCQEEDLTKQHKVRRGVCNIINQKIIKKELDESIFNTDNVSKNTHLQNSEQNSFLEENIAPAKIKSTPEKTSNAPKNKEATMLINENSSVIAHSTAEHSFNSNQSQELTKDYPPILPIDSQVASILIETTLKPTCVPMVSPNLKGKIKKTNRGLNDCIAMLTNKLQQKDETSSSSLVTVISSTATSTGKIENLQLLETISSTRQPKRECILKIPTFIATKSPLLQMETALDLSKKSIGPNILFSSDTEFVESTINKVIEGVIEHKCQEVLTEKLLTKKWTSVDDIIQQVVLNSTSGLLSTSSRRKSTFNVRTHVDDTIDYVVNGSSDVNSSGWLKGKHKSNKEKTKSVGSNRRKEDSNDHLIRNIILGKDKLLIAPFNCSHNNALENSLFAKIKENDSNFSNKLETMVRKVPGRMDNLEPFLGNRDSEVKKPQDTITYVSKDKVCNEKIGLREDMQEIYKVSSSGSMYLNTFNLNIENNSDTCIDISDIQKNCFKNDNDNYCDSEKTILKVTEDHKVQITKGLLVNKPFLKDVFDIIYTDKKNKTKINGKDQKNRFLETLKHESDMNEDNIGINFNGVGLLSKSLSEDDKEITHKQGNNALENNSVLDTKVVKETINSLPSDSEDEIPLAVISKQKKSDHNLKKVASELQLKLSNESSDLKSVAASKCTSKPLDAESSLVKMMNKNITNENKNLTSASANKNVVEAITTDSLKENIKQAVKINTSLKKNDTRSKLNSSNMSGKTRGSIRKRHNFLFVSKKTLDTKKKIVSSSNNLTKPVKSKHVPLDNSVIHKACLDPSKIVAGLKKTEDNFKFKKINKNGHFVPSQESTMLSHVNNQCKDSQKNTNLPRAINVLMNTQRTRRKSKSSKKTDKFDNDLFKDFSLVINKKTKRILPTSIVDDSVCDKALEKPLNVRTTDIVQNAKKNTVFIDSVEEIDMEIEDIPINTNIIERDYEHFEILKTYEENNELVDNVTQNSCIINTMEADNDTTKNSTNKKTIPEISSSSGLRKKQIFNTKIGCLSTEKKDEDTFSTPKNKLQNKMMHKNKAKNFKEVIINKNRPCNNQTSLIYEEQKTSNALESQNTKTNKIVGIDPENNNLNFPLLENTGKVENKVIIADLNNKNTSEEIVKRLPKRIKNNKMVFNKSHTSTTSQRDNFFSKVGIIKEKNKPIFQNRKINSRFLNKQVYKRSSNKKANRPKHTPNIRKRYKELLCKKQTNLPSNNTLSSKLPILNDNKNVQIKCLNNINKIIKTNINSNDTVISKNKRHPILISKGNLTEGYKIDNIIEPEINESAKKTKRNQGRFAKCAPLSEDLDDKLSNKNNYVRKIIQSTINNISNELRKTAKKEVHKRENNIQVFKNNKDLLKHQHTSSDFRDTLLPIVLKSETNEVSENTNETVILTKRTNVQNQTLPGVSVQKLKFKIGKPKIKNNFFIPNWANQPFNILKYSWNQRSRRLLINRKKTFRKKSFFLQNQQIVDAHEQRNFSNCNTEGSFDNKDSKINIEEKSLLTSEVSLKFVEPLIAKNKESMICLNDLKSKVDLPDNSNATKYFKNDSSFCIRRSLRHRSTLKPVGQINKEDNTLQNISRTNLEVTPDKTNIEFNHDNIQSLSKSETKLPEDDNTKVAIKNIFLENNIKDGDLSINEKSSISKSKRQRREINYSEEILRKQKFKVALEDKLIKENKCTEIYSGTNIKLTCNKNIFEKEIQAKNTCTDSLNIKDIGLNVITIKDKPYIEAMEIKKTNDTNDSSGEKKNSVLPLYKAKKIVSSDLKNTMTTKQNETLPDIIKVNSKNCSSFIIKPISASQKKSDGCKMSNLDMENSYKGCSELGNPINFNQASEQESSKNQLDKNTTKKLHVFDFYYKKKDGDKLANSRAGIGDVSKRCDAKSTIIFEKNKTKCKKKIRRNGHCKNIKLSNKLLTSFRVVKDINDFQGTKRFIRKSLDNPKTVEKLEINIEQTKKNEIKENPGYLCKENSTQVEAKLTNQKKYDTHLANHDFKNMEASSCNKKQNVKNFTKSLFSYTSDLNCIKKNTEDTFSKGKTVKKNFSLKAFRTKNTAKNKMDIDIANILSVNVRCLRTKKPGHGNKPAETMVDDNNETKIQQTFAKNIKKKSNDLWSDQKKSSDTKKLQSAEISSLLPISLRGKSQSIVRTVKSKRKTKKQNVKPALLPLSSKEKDESVFVKGTDKSKQKKETEGNIRPDKPLKLGENIIKNMPILVNSSGNSNLIISDTNTDEQFNPKILCLKEHLKSDSAYLRQIQKDILSKHLSFTSLKNVSDNITSSDKTKKQNKGMFSDIKPLTEIITNSEMDIAPILDEIDKSLENENIYNFDEKNYKKITCDDQLQKESDFKLKTDPKLLLDNNDPNDKILSIQSEASLRKHTKNNSNIISKFKTFKQINRKEIRNKHNPMQETAIDIKSNELSSGSKILKESEVVKNGNLRKDNEAQECDVMCFDAISTVSVNNSNIQEETLSNSPTMAVMQDTAIDMQSNELPSFSKLLKESKVVKNGNLRKNNEAQVCDIMSFDAISTVSVNNLNIQEETLSNPPTMVGTQSESFISNKNENLYGQNEAFVKVCTNQSVELGTSNSLFKGETSLSKNTRLIESKQNLNENIYFSNTLKFENQVENLTNGQELRRSRRGCQKIASYNENDLIHPLFNALENRKKRPIRKEKSDVEPLIKKDIETSLYCGKSKSNHEDFTKLNQPNFCTDFQYFIDKEFENKLEKPSLILTDKVKGKDIDKIYEFTEDSSENTKNEFLNRKNNVTNKQSLLIESKVSLANSNSTENNRFGYHGPAHSDEKLEQLNYCKICNKSFIRIENLIKHRTTLTHISKLSEMEAKEAEVKAQLEPKIPAIDGSKEVLKTFDSSRNEIKIGHILEQSEVTQNDSPKKSLLMTNRQSLNLADIISDVLNKPELDNHNSETHFSKMSIGNLSKLGHYKSLGERKSFESENKVSQLNTPVSNYSTTATSKTTILENQINLLENLIGNKLASFPFKENNPSSNFSNEMFSCSDTSNISALDTNLGVLNKYILDTKLNDIQSTDPIQNDFIKPTQYEEMLEDSVLAKTHEDAKLRKTLNRDEALFLECCSLLKSGSEVSNSNYSKNIQNHLSFEQCPKAKHYEKKLCQTVEEAHAYSDNLRTPTPLGDTYDDEASNSNTISSNWNLKSEKPLDNNRSFSFKEVINKEEVGISFGEILTNGLRNQFEFTSKLENRSEVNFDCSTEKMSAKRARKVFDGLKVSIPTEDLNLELLNKGEEIKGLNNEKTFPIKNQTMMQTKSRSTRKSKPVKKLQIGNSLFFKVNRKKTIPQRGQNKKQDSYTFKATHDNTKTLTSHGITLFNHEKKANGSDNESLSYADSIETNTKLLTGHSAMSGRSMDNTGNITKKKYKIMGKIFKNAAKSKNIEINKQLGNIPEIPQIDNFELVENYVRNCQRVQNLLPPSELCEEIPKKPKMTAEEMNLLFDQLLGKKIDELKSVDNLLLPKSKAENKVKAVKKRNIKIKSGKRCRLDSESSGDEFNINRTERKRTSKKNNQNDSGINLELELRECIGVASRKSQRKCTSGKQNVLVEYWSSDEEAFEIMLDSQKDLPKKRYERKKSKQEKYEKNKLKSYKIIKKPKEIPLIPKSNKELQPFKTLETTTNTDLGNTSTVFNRRKRAAANPLYHWSSSSEDESQTLIEIGPIREEYDEEDRPVQHGWIVGDSPKKLVTMLALTKGKKNDIKNVKRQVKRRTNIVS